MLIQINLASTITLLAVCVRHLATATKVTVSPMGATGDWPTRNLSQGPAPCCLSSDFWLPST